jgi:type VI secretion system secreted protein Hcp
MTKSMDKASSELFAQAIFGKSLGTATVEFVQTSGDGSKPQVYLIYKLSEAIVSSYSVSSGGDRPNESISINFTKISKQYNDFKEGKQVDKGNEKKWDLMANKTF